jgi:hypothetical protein
MTPGRERVAPPPKARQPGMVAHERHQKRARDRPTPGAKGTVMVRSLVERIGALEPCKGVCAVGPSWDVAQSEARASSAGRISTAT